MAALLISRDGVISLVDELIFMLISSRHICIRSVSANAFMKPKVHDALHLD